MSNAYNYFVSLPLLHMKHLHFKTYIFLKTLEDNVVVLSRVYALLFQVSVTPVRIPETGSVAHILYALNYSTGTEQQVGNFTDSWLCPELETEREGGKMAMSKGNYLIPVCMQSSLSYGYYLGDYIQVKLQPNHCMQYLTVIECILVKTDHTYRQSNLQTDFRDWDQL